MTALLGILAAVVKITTFALFGTAAVAYSGYRLSAGRTTPRPGRNLARCPPSRRRVRPPRAPDPRARRLVDQVHRRGQVGQSLRRAIYVGEPEQLEFWQSGAALGPGFLAHRRLGPAPGHPVWLDAVPPRCGARLVAPRYRRAALVCAAGFLIGPLLFSNLYEVHDYYFFPSAFFAAGAAGLILAGVVESPRLGATVKTLVLVVFFGLQAVNFNRYYAITLKGRSTTPPPLATIIRLATPQDGIVLVHGWDWNTLIPYYAERRTILVPGNQEDDVHVLLEVLGRLPPGSVAGLVMQGPHKNDAAFIHWRTRLLNLSPTPVAKSPDGDLYLPVADRPAGIKARSAPRRSGRDLGFRPRPR